MKRFFSVFFNILLMIIGFISIIGGILGINLRYTEKELIYGIAMLIIGVVILGFIFFKKPFKK